MVRASFPSLQVRREHRELLKGIAMAAQDESASSDTKVSLRNQIVAA